MTATLSPAEPLSAFVERARELYSLPAVAMRVLELTSAPQLDARALRDCIEHDPALTARLLRAVNSPLFGLSRQVTDLNQALALLGVKPLKLLVLGFSLPRALFEGLETHALAAFWRRTLTKAAAARLVSDAAWPRHSDEAFLGGLLQDVGQLALVQDLGEAYAAFLDRQKQAGGDLAACELETLGFDHAMLSARLLEAWKLPRALVAAVAQRQNADSIQSLPGAERPVAQALHLAELTARVSADRDVRALAALEDTAHAYAHVSPEGVARLLRTLEETVSTLADALDLELSDPPDVDALLAEAQALRAEVRDAAHRELKQAADETRRWQEADALRAAVARFVGSPKSHAQREPDEQDSRSLPPAGGDPGLLGRIEEAVQHGRQRRTAVSLLVAAIDREAQMAFGSGREGIRRAVEEIAALGASLGDVQANSLAVDAGCVALVLEDCDRPHAVAVARRWLDAVPCVVSAGQERFARPVTISVGAATLSLPPKNFPPRELAEAAWRCLYAAQLAGGDGVKSIDI